MSQAHLYMFPISLRLTEMEVRSVSALCEEGGVYAVRFLTNRYRYLKQIDAIRVVKRVQEMRRDGSLPVSREVPRQGGLYVQYGRPALRKESA